MIGGIDQHLQRNDTAGASSAQRDGATPDRSDQGNPSGPSSFADYRQRLALRLAGLDAVEASFEKRGFRASDPERRERLEGIGTTFLAGYNRALGTAGVNAVVESIAQQPTRLRGFFAEGAAMGIAVSDALPVTGSPRLTDFLEATPHHAYLTHVGVGWAMARLPWRRATLRRVLTPLLVPLSLDGRGFHDVYFAPKRLRKGLGDRRRLDRNRSWDQGAGRAIWFVAGGDVDRALQMIDGVATHRHADLYAGLGLALTYAAGAEPAELKKIRKHASTYRAHLAQGAAFAAEARHLAGTVTAECEHACLMLTDLHLADAVALVKHHRPSPSAVTSALPKTPDTAADTPSHDYEHWRSRVRESLLGVVPSGD